MDVLLVRIGDAQCRSSSMRHSHLFSYMCSSFFQRLMSTTYRFLLCSCGFMETFVFESNYTYEQTRAMPRLGQSDFVFINLGEQVGGGFGQILVGDSSATMTPLGTSAQPCARCDIAHADVCNGKQVSTKSPMGSSVRNDTANLRTMSWFTSPTKTAIVFFSSAAN